MRTKKYLLIVFGAKSITVLCAIALVYTVQSAIITMQQQFDWLFSPIMTLADYTDNLKNAQRDNQLFDLMALHNDRGQTPLMYAIDQDNLDRVRALLAFGANPDMVDKGLYEGSSDNTALHRAVYHGDSTNTIPIIDALLQAGANPKLANDHGSTPLHLTGWITDSINNKNNDPSQFGRRMQVIKLLVNAGADLNAQDMQGKTLLHLMVDKHDANFIAQLIMRYASVINLGIQNRDGLSPFEYAQRLFEPDPIELLSALSIPVFVIGANGDIGMTDSQGNTGLMLAIMRNDKKTVANLLARGANVQTQANNGNTALHYAVVSADPIGYTKLLLERNAQPNILNASGLTPLQLIPLIGDAPTRYVAFNLLVSAGASLLVRNILGDSLLHRAVKNQDRELVERIIKQMGANMQNNANLKNNLGYTAYNLAQAMEFSDIAKPLEVYNK